MQIWLRTLERERRMVKRPATAKTPPAVGKGEPKKGKGIPARRDLTSHSDTGLRSGEEEEDDDKPAAKEKPKATGHSSMLTPKEDWDKLRFRERVKRKQELRDKLPRGTRGAGYQSPRKGKDVVKPICRGHHRERYAATP